MALPKYLLIIGILINSDYAQNTTEYPSSITTQTIIDQTNFMTTPMLTVADYVVDALEEAMNNQLELSNNVYTWNVTLIVKLINETNPEYLYDSDNIALVTAVLPDYILKQLPVSLLIYHGLCEYINMNTTDYLDCIKLNLTLPTIDYCVGPLIHSNIKSEAQSASINGSYPLINCGLSCRSSQDIWGLTKNEQYILDTFKIIGCTLCFILIIWMIYNQFMDQKKGGIKLKQKPLLQQIPYIITACLFMIVFCMTISEIIGKPNILCQNARLNDNDDNDYPNQDKQFSSENPLDGQDAICTIDGILFYSSYLFYISYSSLLSFVIFRSLYSPLKPLWNISNKYWHLLIIIFVSIFEIIAIAEADYSAVWPMGVCVPCQNVLVSLCVPILICAVISVMFLIFSSILLKKQVEKQRGVTNEASIKTMRDLLIRLIVYSFGITLVLILLLITGFIFEEKGDIIFDDFVNLLLCQIEEAIIDPNWSHDTSECYQNRTIKMNIFWFLSWIIVCIIGVLAQTTLSCHENAKKRLLNVVTTVTSKTKQLTIDIVDTSKYSKNSNDTKLTDFGADTSTIQLSNISPMTPKYDDDDINLNPSKIQKVVPDTDNESENEELTNL